MTKSGHNHRGTPRQTELLTRGLQAEDVVLAHRTNRFDLQRHVAQDELRAGDPRDQLSRLRDELFATLPGDVPHPVGHVGHVGHVSHVSHEGIRPRPVRPP
ncbi:hypothetical protein AB0O75_38935 [Streptomyces sp. NPDC088921]|uniref:hypothetical protein n=1 Tax=unclassified Streptomyces TaxID=2593676 RepID=UPI00342DE390